MVVTLYDRERLSPTLAQELRDLAEAAATEDTARERLEEALLGLLSISRDLDWTSLSDLVRRTPDVATLNQFATASRMGSEYFPLLFTASMLSGDVAATAQYWLKNGDRGRAGLREAMRAGAGSLRWLVRDGRQVRPGVVTPTSWAVAAYNSPRGAIYARSGLFILSALLLTTGLTLFGSVEPMNAGPNRDRHWMPGIIVTGLIGAFLVVASEPLPELAPVTPKYKFHIDNSVLTKANSIAKADRERKYIMGSSTLLTIGIFAAIQVAVYAICLRKIGEIARLPESPLVRLRLLENEENLFDSGLYVGIGGTAAALVLQVLQLVEANLLAAYSSNLMGIIGVALIKIGHVRSAKRRLILQSQESAMPVPSPKLAGDRPAPMPEPPRENPFAVR